jgi:hypothetical protein
MEVLVMKLSSRFAFDILFLVAGAFLAVTAMTFAAPVAGWIAFGVSAGLAVLVLTTTAFSRRTSQRAGHALIGLVALWSLVAALVFSGTVLTWVILADAVALGIAAIADLTAHEIAEENVVHRLEVTHAASSTQAAA